MDRKKLVLARVFNVLKEEELLAKITNTGSLEDGYHIIKEKLEDSTEEEYREAIRTIKENNGKVEIFSDEEMELSDEDLEKVSGGAMEYEAAFLKFKGTAIEIGKETLQEY